MKIDELFEKRMRMAENGRELWKNILKEYENDAPFAVLLLPPGDEAYHQPALRYFPDYIKKMNLKQGVILTTEGTEIEENSQICPLVKKITKEDSEALIAFYSMYEFSDKLIIASLEQPAGRLGKHMIGRKGLTIEDAVKVMLYDLYEE